MEISLELLKIQNAWWVEGRMKHDPVLDKLDELDIEYKPKILDDLKLEEGQVSLVQGARGVGKTSMLKLKIKDLIDRGIDPKNIFYYSCHNLNTKEQLNEIIKLFLHWRKKEQAEESGLYIFIDEITLVKNWQKGISYLQEARVLDHVACVLTGSFYADDNEDKMDSASHWHKHLLRSLSFREFVEIMDPQMSSELAKDESSYAFYENRVEYYLNIFYLTGGHISAISSYLKSSSIRQDSYSAYLYWLISDIARLGRDLVLFRQILEELIKNGSEPFGFKTLGKKTKARTHNTVSEYARIIQSMFIMQFQYQLEKEGGAKKSAAKKMFFRDPFIFWVYHAYIYGALNYWQFSREYILKPDIFENLLHTIVFDHLLRKETFDDWGEHLFFWRSANSRHEIPFIYSREAKSMPILFRYNCEYGLSDKKIFKMAGYEDGIIITRNKKEDLGKTKVLPLPYFLLYY